ncbi:hypothetical protein [Streptomyces sp. NBC_01304]|uniref:hypothetical protein n=1 Tax=Streptomyces sp. NBC_01304 TaxID=2903818 RepID=UPI002E12830D|nr:hypothetical protein OG430_35230 [Streptomyces sp. NBC_01304]
MTEQGQQDQQEPEQEPDRDKSRDAEADAAGADTGRAGEPGPGKPLDEDAAWAAIVAGYGEQPVDPPGAKPFKSVEDLAGLVAEANGVKEAVNDAPEPEPAPDDDASKPVAGSITFAPGVGPRDYEAPEASDDDLGSDDEGHFVPPEPPPLPPTDATARFAWLAVIGGPLLLLLAVLLGWEMTWWLTTLGIGGFVGGFATLVMRMQGDDEDDDDPGRGAVV